MAGELWLVDTNILLRLVNRNHPEYGIVRGAVDLLRSADFGLAYTFQNMTEFWNASTRPVDRNGFGLSIEETERNVRQIEMSFSLLADTGSVYREWRRLVEKHEVRGVQVHDARLAATMLAYGIGNILTLNPLDFSRFQGVKAIHPRHIAIGP